MNAINLPTVDPLMVRRFTPKTPTKLFGGVLVAEHFEVEDIGMAESRFMWDEDAVDCSNRIFEITNFMLMLVKPVNFCAFPARRWRNLRNGCYSETTWPAGGPLIDRLPDADTPLLYIGNPVQLIFESSGLAVIRSPEWRIRTGVELQLDA